MRKKRVWSEYQRGWWRDKRQAGRIAWDYKAEYFDAGCVEVLEESGRGSVTPERNVRFPLTEG